MRTLRIVGLALALGPVWAGATAADAVAQTVMKIGLAVQPTHIQNAGSEAFKMFIEERTGGAIRVEIYPAAQLGDNKAMLGSVQFGAVDAIFPSPADLGNFAHDFNILNFPFLFESQAIANTITDGPWGDRLLGTLDSHGYKGLAIVDSGFRHTTNNRRPITTLDDFQGLKIRMQPNPLHLAIFQALGANPVPLSFSEVFLALQQGVIDGQENPLNNIYASKFNEVQRYLTLTGHVFDVNVFLVGTTFYENLTPEQQALFQEGADLVVRVMRDALLEQDAAAMAGIEQSGVAISEVSPEFRAQLVEATRLVAENHLAEVDGELYLSLQAEIQRLSDR